MKKAQILFIVIILLALFIRIFRLGSIPAGFANDEAAIAYQAYSVLETGKDTWGNFLPLFSFKDFGEYLPPFAPYVLIPFIKFIGLSEFGLRAPFALTGVLAIFPLYILTKALFKKREVALLACFLFAISPLNIGWSRFVYEGNFGMLFYLLGITLFVLARKNIKILPFSIVFFGLTLTTYHIYYLLTPITVIMLSLSELKNFWTQSYRISLATVLIGVLFTIYGFLIVQSGAGKERFRQVSIFANQNIVNEVNINRSFCNRSFAPFVCRLFSNKVTAYLFSYSYNYLLHFSPTFLAIDGSFLRQTILPKSGLIYPFELPFFWLGVAILISTRKYASYVLLLWLILYPLANSFTGVGEISRITHIMPLFPIISAFGLVSFFVLINRLKYKGLLLSALIFLAAHNILSFFINYFVIFPKTNSHFASGSYVKLFKQIKQGNYHFSRYFITRDFSGGSPELQARIFLPIDPQAFQNASRNEYVVKEPQKYIDYKRLDNFYFFDNPQELDTSKNDLVVLSKNQVRASDTILFELNEPNGDLSLIGVVGGNKY